MFNYTDKCWESAEFSDFRSYILQGQALLFGGLTSGSRDLDDTWLIVMPSDTMSQWSWKQLHSVGTAPSARHDHAASFISNNNVVFYVLYDYYFLRFAFLADAAIMEDQSNI